MIPSSHRAVIGLGANLGDRLATLQAATSAIAKTPGLELLAREVHRRDIARRVDFAAGRSSPR